MNWFQKVASTESLLAPPRQYPGVGNERGEPVYDGIARYDDEFGSSRYVYYVSGQAVSGLQVVSRDGSNALIANVFTDPNFRHQRYATLLLEQANQDFNRVEHSQYMNEHSEGWRDSQGNK